MICFLPDFRGRRDMNDVLNDIEREIPRLRRYARYLTNDIDQADDLVQDCLERAITKIETFQPNTNLRAWLFVVLKSIFVNSWRREQRSPIRASPSLDNIVFQSPGNQEAHLQLIEVQNAFDTLPDEHREILLLVAIEGMQYEVAAEVLKIAVGTVRSRLSRARSSLREKLEDGAPQHAVGEP